MSLIQLQTGAKVALALCCTALAISNVEARPMGAAKPELNYKLVAGGVVGAARCEIVDGITFRLLHADGSSTSYRIAHIRLPQGEPAMKAAAEELRRLLERDKVAIYSAGEILEEAEQSLHLAFLNTARGLFSAAQANAGLADPNGREATVPDGTSAQDYAAEIVKAWRAAEERERGQFGDLRPPPPDNRVNVNTATSAELEELPGIGPSTAAKIISARPLRSNSDIKTIDGIGPATWNGIKDRIKVR